MSDENPTPPTSDRPRRGNMPAARTQRDEPSIEVSDDVPPERLQRRSRRGGTENPYEVPKHLKKKGWDYEWKNDVVMGQPVPASERVTVHEAHWTPVPASDMPEMCPPGWDKKYIERDGMTLMMRPAYLSEEARAEDYAIAMEQKNSKLAAGAVGANISSDPRMPARVEKVEVVHEVGKHKTKAA